MPSRCRVGDPLAAALAAGETPSPQMVAASRSKEGLRPAVGWGLLAVAILAWLAMMSMNDRLFLHRRIPFEKSSDVLVERSREIIKKAGYTEKFADSAYGFVENSDLLRYIENSDKTANRWKTLDAKAILFWYRQSPRRFGARLGKVAPNDPPLQFSGEVLVTLDPEGRLISLREAPPQVQPSEGSAQAPDWTVFFSEAGLNISQWSPVNPQWRPLSYADSRAAWQGSLPNRPSTPIRIEAAALQGKPVSFEIIGPWTRAAQMQPVQRMTGEYIFALSAILIIVPAVVGGVFFARRNLRLGRGGRRNANRLALFVLCLSILSWILQVPKVSAINLLLSPYIAALVWILYLAIELFVRRRWPQVLVSWTRLLSGDWRDPLVARDILIGSASGALIHCIDRFSREFVPSWLGRAELTAPVRISFDAVMGTRFFVSEWLSGLLSDISSPLFMICLLIVMRILLRNQKAAITACILVFALYVGPQSPWSFAIAMAIGASYFFVLMRFGIVATVLLTTALFFDSFPITFDASAWYFGYSFAALAIFAVLVLYAFRTSFGGRPLLAPSHLGD